MQPILPECGLCVPTSSYARKSSSRYWLASSVPVAGHPKSPPPWIIITLRCAKSSIEPLKPLAWRSPEQQTGARLSRQHVVVRASISGLMTCHLRAALLPKQDIDIFAPGNLGVRRDEMVAQLALAHDCACLVEGLS